MNALSIVSGGNSDAVVVMTTPEDSAAPTEFLYPTESSFQNGSIDRRFSNTPSSEVGIRWQYTYTENHRTITIAPSPSPSPSISPSHCEYSSELRHLVHEQNYEARLHFGSCSSICINVWKSFIIFWRWSNSI